MGLIGTVKQVLRRLRAVPVDDIEADLGGNDLATAENFAPIGEDSQCLPGDLVFAVDKTGEGRVVSVGFIDPKAEQLAAAGERRLYSRDGEGSRVAQIWLKNTGEILLENAEASAKLLPDGAIELKNGNGSVTLGEDGVVNANGSTIATDGDITCPGTIKAAKVEAPSIEAAGLELAGHLHTKGTDPVTGNTGPNLP